MTVDAVIWKPKPSSSPICRPATSTAAPVGLCSSNHSPNVSLASSGFCMISVMTRSPTCSASTGQLTPPVSPVASRPVSPRPVSPRPVSSRPVSSPPVSPVTSPVSPVSIPPPQRSFSVPGVPKSPAPNIDVAKHHRVGSSLVAASHADGSSDKLAPGASTHSTPSS